MCVCVYVLRQVHAGFHGLIKEHINANSTDAEQGTFKLLHYAGDVVYTVAGFLDKNTDTLFKDLSRVRELVRPVLRALERSRAWWSLFHSLTPSLSHTLSSLDMVVLPTRQLTASS